MSWAKQRIKPLQFLDDELALLVDAVFRPVEDVAASRAQLRGQLVHAGDLETEDVAIVLGGAHKFGHSELRDGRLEADGFHDPVAVAARCFGVGREARCRRLRLSAATAMKRRPPTPAASKASCRR